MNPEKDISKTTTLFTLTCLTLHGTIPYTIVMHFL